MATTNDLCKGLMKFGFVFGMISQIRRMAYLVSNPVYCHDADILIRKYELYYYLK